MTNFTELSQPERILLGGAFWIIVLMATSFVLRVLNRIFRMPLYVAYAIVMIIGSFVGMYGAGNMVAHFTPKPPAGATERELKYYDDDIVNRRAAVQIPWVWALSLTVTGCAVAVTGLVLAVADYETYTARRATLWRERKDNRDRRGAQRQRELDKAQRTRQRELDEAQLTRQRELDEAQLKRTIDRVAARAAEKKDTDEAATVFMDPSITITSGPAPMIDLDILPRDWTTDARSVHKETGLDGH